MKIEELRSVKMWMARPAVVGFSFIVSGPAYARYSIHDASQGNPAAPVKPLLSILELLPMISSICPTMLPTVSDAGTRYVCHFRLPPDVLAAGSRISTINRVRDGAY